MLKVRYVIKLDGELFYYSEYIKEAWEVFKVLRRAFVAGKLLSKPKNVILEKEIWDTNTHKVEIVTLVYAF